MVFTLSRDDASKMLWVSTRTIDRYVQSGKIRSKRDGKVIMLHKDDVSHVKNWGTQTDYEVIAPKPTLVPSIGYDPREAQNEILRAIEALIKEKDALIQELTFKIGKMEGELMNSVPKIEHKRTLLALEETNHSRMQDMDMIVQTKKDIESKFQREKLISTVLMIVVFVLLCLCVVLMFHFFNVRSDIINNS